MAAKTPSKKKSTKRTVKTPRATAPRVAKAKTTTKSPAKKAPAKRTASTSK